MHHYPKLMQNVSTHIAIIGGGIMGALSAWHLTAAGIECVLVDKRSIGLGSTCASTSLLQYELDQPLHLLKEQVGNRRAERSYQICGEAIEKLLALMEDTGYRDFDRSPSLFYSNKKEEKRFMEYENEARKNAGFQVELLESSDLERKYGLNARFGILSALGATVDTYTLTHHLLQYCIKKGLQVYDRTNIISLEDRDQGIDLKTQENQTISAKVVINATGYEVIDFLDSRIVNFDCTYAIASEHQSEKEALWKDHAMMWNTDNPYLYLRLTRDNRLLAGGRDEPFSTRVTRHLFLDKKARLLEKDVKQILPAIQIKTEFAWCGTFGKTKDSLPFIGSYKSPRIYYALGFGGNGITFGMVGAEIICDLVQGRNNPDASLFAFSR